MNTTTTTAAVTPAALTSLVAGDAEQRQANRDFLEAVPTGATVNRISGGRYRIETGRCALADQWTRLDDGTLQRQSYPWEVELPPLPPSLLSIGAYHFTRPA